MHTCKEEMISPAAWCKPSAATAAPVNHTMHAQGHTDNQIHKAPFNAQRGTPRDRRSTVTHPQTLMIKKRTVMLSIILPLIILTALFAVNNPDFHSKSSRLITVKRER